LGDGAIFEGKQTGFFVPKERATGFAIVSSVDAIRAPKASSSATRPSQALGYFYLDANLPSFSWARSQVPGSSAINGMLAGLDPHSSYTCSR
jgi:hypothetical protein